MEQSVPKRWHIALLRQQCHNSKFVIFQEKILNALKCYNFLWVQRRHYCCPAASFANCVMTLYLLKLHLQTFVSIPITQKYQILSCDFLVPNEWYIYTYIYIWNSEVINDTSPYISLNIDIRLGLILDLLPRYANVTQSWAKFWNFNLLLHRTVFPSNRYHSYSVSQKKSRAQV